VQSRSALTFIKDVIERISGEDAEVDGRLRQVSAADLVIGSMLPELVAAERETGECHCRDAADTAREVSPGI
jgi:hypothetical protein